MTRCKELNGKAIEVAEQIAVKDQTTWNNYQNHGKKLVLGDDIEEVTEASFVKNMMKFIDSDDKSQSVVQSTMNAKQIDNDGQGIHMCKLLSPYRALEWIYIDSIIDYSKRLNGLESEPKVEYFLQ